MFLQVLAIDPIGGLIRSSFFLMYLHLFRPLKWLRWACYTGMVITWAFHIGRTIGSIYVMVPNPGQSWQASLTNPRRLKTAERGIPYSVGGLLLDVYILILPMIVLSKLKVSKTRRLELIAIFATGALCVSAFRLFSEIFSTANV